MPRETKTDREKRQAEGFLSGLVIYDKLEQREPPNDPPDIRLWRDGFVVLHLEVTEYHDDEQEVANNSRWNVRLWPKIDDLRKQDPALKYIYAFVAFSGNKVPRLSQAENIGLADELVKLAGEVGGNLKDTESLKLSFAARSVCTSYPVITPRWHQAASEDWPLSAKHIGAVTFSRGPDAWPRWMCPGVDMGWTQKSLDKFRSIFSEKEDKVRNAMSDSNRFVPGAPTWLLIVSDLDNDLTTHLFPTSPEDKDELFNLIHACNVDFAHSPFSQVWLYADFDKASLRLFPTSK